MKQTSNNEIDLLLRSLARPGRSGAVVESEDVSGHRAFSNHLDADELNSYAEGLVSAPARARYMEHLADCDSCRRLVIRLIRATGTASQYETLHRHSGAAFWEKWAALFRPTVLRYAVPALVLSGVIALAILALRQERHSEFVAQNQPASTSTATTERPQTESPLARPVSESPLMPQKESGSPANGDSKGEKSNAADKTGVAQVPGTTAGIPKSSDKDLSRSREAASVAEVRPSFAPEPQAPPPPRPASAETNKMVQKEQAAEREAGDRSRVDYRNQSRDEVEAKGPIRARTQTLPTAGRTLGGLASVAPGKADDTAKRRPENEAETRKVSGRTFRRQGNAWIDTAYEPSRATTNVTRGSEQFRALVADEPAIRSIADQLGGEVIVVWKGRAYRIH